MKHHELPLLKTITDFDLGVGGSVKDYVRVSEDDVGDVTIPEINLITWLLLEKEFKNYDDDGSTTSCGGGGGDSIDAATFRTETDSPKRIKNQARKYSEDLLRAVGVTVPFDLLGSAQREELFQKFSSQSNLLRNERFSSILELYEALRRRSKFREEFQVLEVIGEGAFGTVYGVQSKAQLTFALKRIFISSFDALDSIQSVLNESNVLKQLSPHPGIPCYVDSWLELDENESDTLVFYLQMELCHLPLSRWRELNPTIELSPNHLLAITRQLLVALEWIHRNNFLHLDINPQNILWGDPSCKTVKISDFGLAVRSDAFHCRCGTIPYCAPEHSLVPKSDVYSLGVALFEVSQCFSTRSELMRRIERRDLTTGVYFLDKILPLMLKKQVVQRPSASELLRILADYE